MEKSYRDQRKLIVSDFDGVLLNDEKYIDSITMQAIHDYIKSGNYLVIATGRTFRYIEKYYKLLQLTTPVIIYNGAAVYDPVRHEFLYNLVLNSDQCDFLFNTFKTKEIEHKKLKGWDQTKEFDKFEISWDYEDFLIPYRGCYGWVDSVCNRERRVRIYGLMDEIPNKAHKITISYPKELYDDTEYRREINEFILRDFYYHTWFTDTMAVYDIHHKDASKINAYKKLCKLDARFKGFANYKNTHFVIEGRNDLSFIQQEKNLSIIALDNSIQEIKDYKGVVKVDKTNNNGGFCEIVQLISKVNNTEISSNKCNMFFDICRYSKFDNKLQLMIIQNITDILLYLFNNDYALMEHDIGHRGDGFVISFSINAGEGLNRQFLRVLKFLCKFVNRVNSNIEEKGFDYNYRISLSFGSVYEYIDYNGNVNFAGKGINDGERIMSFSECNHILVGSSFWEQILNEPEIVNSNYQTQQYHEKDKHGVMHHFYNIYLHQGFGNPEPINS